MNTDIDSSHGTVAEFLARSWWLMAIRGLVAVLFGVTAFIAPKVTILTLVYLFGAFAMANGILSLVVAFKVPKGTIGRNESRAVLRGTTLPPNGHPVLGWDRIEPKLNDRDD